MSRTAGWLFVGVICAAAGSAAANCNCQCIEGVLRTVCTTVDEAAADPRACGADGRKVECEAAPSSASPPQWFAPPAGAQNCRAVRMWDPSRNDYSTIAKVCDPKRGRGAKG